MSFPRNDGHLIEQLEQQYHGMIIVLYTKKLSIIRSILKSKRHKDDTF